jgi:hypothetical protein
MDSTNKQVHPAVLFGCQHLAAAVIKQAVADLLDPNVPFTVRSDARRFLAGSDDYRFWCRMSGVDPMALLHNDQ